MCYNMVKEVEISIYNRKGVLRMLAEQRYQKILGLLREHGSVRAAELKEKLNVSSETVRRDLEYMEIQGLIRRARGGAFLNESAIQARSPTWYTPFGIRGKERAESKREIAEFAVGFIKEGQSIALDSGTTAFALARAVKDRFKSITVVTNSMAIANELSDAKGVTLIVTGGVYRWEEAAFISDMAGLIFSKLNIDLFFMTTCGISVERGVTYQRMDEILVQEKMMDASEKTVVIADSSKLGINSLVKMCDVDRISMIITDSDAKERQIKPFAKAGIPVKKM